MMDDTPDTLNYENAELSSESFLNEETIRNALTRLEGGGDDAPSVDARRPTCLLI
jgi:hypothetical protein